MSVAINEPVKAIISFTPGQVNPISFVWRHRQIRVESVTFSWQTDEGQARLWHFSVLANKTLYELIFNPSTLGWRLEKLEAG